jgi:hypothetical protein
VYFVLNRSINQRESTIFSPRSAAKRAVRREARKILGFAVPSSLAEIGSSGRRHDIDCSLEIAVHIGQLLLSSA